MRTRAERSGPPRESYRALLLAALLCPLSGRVMAAATAPAVDVSTSAAGLMLGSGTGWLKWLSANFPLKSALTGKQERALKPFSGVKWDERFVGALYGDGTAGALLVKFSPSGKTLTRLAVLRWSKGSWKPMLRCGRKKVVYAKAKPVTSTESVDVYQVYLQRQSEGLGFLITFGKDGDKLFGDAISLSYDAGARSYVQPDDSDHD